MAILRKVKEKLNKMVSKKKSTRAVRTVSRKKAQKPAPAPMLQEVKKEVLGAREMAVEQTKFSHPEIKKFHRPMPSELPPAYGKDKMVLQVRDPWWLYCYWEIAVNTWNSIKDRLKDIFYSAKRVLRIYDVSHVIFNGKNAHRYFDIEVSHEANNWYIDAGGPGRSWVVDYGLKLPNGEFITVLRSNVVTTPSDGPSWITDEEWMIPDEMFGRLYGLGFGFGQSSPVGKAWQERFKRALFSGVLASPGIASAASPVKKKAKERGFWLIVDCELIVYGATEPDAKVTVQGKPIKLRPDGTFTLRYALPDGKQFIPVKAISADEIEERTITPIVSRETKSSVLVKEGAKA
jgi:hypothetical protein